jgi:hypothetical protein
MNMIASALSRVGVTSQGSAGSEAGTVPVTMSAGGMNFRVFIGERELTDIVVEQIDESNSNTLRRARAGTGRAR